MLYYIKKQPLSSLVVLVIWILCMIPVPETPLDNVQFIDKWVHLVMYGGFVFIALSEYGYRHNSICWPRLLIWGLVLPIIMGGLVELAQAYLTFGARSGDWIDFGANSCGAILGFVFALPVLLFFVKRNEKRHH